MDNLQYQLSNGTWMDCDERTDEFLARCETTTNLARDEVIGQLLAGKIVSNDLECWYSKCRAKPESRPAPTSVEMVCCSCGHSAPRVSVMSASMGTSCPDCYDRMSD